MFLTISKHQLIQRFYGALSHDTGTFGSLSKISFWSIIIVSWQLKWSDDLPWKLLSTLKTFSDPREESDSGSEGLPDSDREDPEAPVILRRKRYLRTKAVLLISINFVQIRIHNFCINLGSESIKISLSLSKLYPFYSLKCEISIDTFKKFSWNLL